MSKLSPLFFPGNRVAAMPGGTHFRKALIVGVVRDFYDRSLRQPIRPFMFRMWRPWNSFIFVKVDKNRVSEALGEIKEMFGTFAPDYAFTFSLHLRRFSKHRNPSRHAYSWPLRRSVPGPVRAIRAAG